MKQYRVNILPHAQSDLEQIHDYIAHTLLSPLTAKKTVSALRKEILSLDTMPRRIKLTDEEPWRSIGIHRMRVKNYYVYFWIDEEGLCVHVAGVIYSARNQIEQLKHMEL